MNNLSDDKDFSTEGAGVNKDRQASVGGAHLLRPQARHGKPEEIPQTGSDMGSAEDMEFGKPVVVPQVADFQQPQLTYRQPQQPQPFTGDEADGFQNNLEAIPEGDQDEDKDQEENVYAKAQRRANFLDSIKVIIIALIVMFGVRTFIGEPYRVPTGSMLQTIQLGDTLWGDKVSLHFQKPAYKDVVTFTDPDNPKQTLIKRVIATGGQTVDLKGGKVYVDGKELKEPYTNGQPSFPIAGQWSQKLNGPIQYPIKIPAGSLWVMGDNRGNSLDSRYFGPIPESSVTSRAQFIFWPPKDFRSL